MTVNQPSPPVNGAETAASMNGSLANGDAPAEFNGVHDESNGAEIKEDRLIVGVDFGTTYSGVAAVYSATPDDVDIIKSWPGGIKSCPGGRKSWPRGLNKWQTA